MGKPYSMDLRQRVVAAIEGGLSTRQAAARFAIGIATAGAEAGDGGGSACQTGQAEGRRA
jgi:transposase